MPTAEFTVWIEEDRQEQIIIALEEMGFEAFWQEDDRLRAYVPANELNRTLLDHIQKWLRIHGLEATVDETIVEDQNWNEQWEASLEPIYVDPFVIASSTRALDDDDRIQIRIDPKCSFGTGYHESTRLVLKLLPQYIKGGEKVMDAGAGTGILSVAAIKLGAERSISFDNDEWAQENATENFVENGVANQVEFRSGSLEVVPGDDFDVILANINREVLIKMLPVFREKLRAEGIVILSGLLLSDKPIMLDHFEELGFTVQEEVSENEWWSVSVRSLLSGT